MGMKFSNGWKFAAALLAPFCALAASPNLNSCSPPGGQRGTACDITIRGLRLEGAKQLLFYKSGIEVEMVSNDATAKATKVYARLKIAPDAQLTEYPFRLRTESGISDVMLFRVGPFPNVDEVEPNSEFTAPQKVALNSTINGIVKSEDVDHYVIEAKKGQRISAEVEGIRIGQVMFDPYIAILDTNRFELGASDDTTLFKQDGAISAIAPYDGQYIVQIRETSYRGSESSRYRLHVGIFARPEVVYPLGGQTGQEVAVRFIGDAGGVIESKIKLPDTVNEDYGVFPPNDPPPSPNPFRVVSFPNVMEEDFGGDTNKATITTLMPPLAFNGILAKDGERDQFTFPVKKGQSYEVHVYARGMGSQLDPTISIRAPGKGSVGNNDDTKGLDSYMQFRAEADGNHTLTIRDHLKNGGSNYVYRVEITGTEPQLSLGVPIFKRETQERQAVPVPRGNRNGVLLSVRKENVDGALALAAKDLPPGVVATFPTLHPGMTQIPVLFEAAPGTALAGGLVDLNITPADETKKITGRMDHDVELVYGEPNQTMYYKTPLNRMAVAVTEDAPFTIEVEEPKVPIVQGGIYRLGVNVKRKEGFDGAVSVRTIWNPPGINAPSEITIGKGETRGIIQLQAGGDSQPKVWQTAIIGVSSADGDLWVASPFFNLEVATPYANGKFTMTSTEQGQPAELMMDLTNFKPFEGKAKLVLSGLPVRATAEPVEFTKDDKRVVFKITTEDKTPVGQHKGLFCNADIPLKEGIVNQTVAVEGVLRVDAPRKKTVEEPKKEVAKVEPPKTDAPVLSRLEQLRKEQSAAGGAMTGK